MSNEKSVSKKLSSLIFGEPIPVLSNNDIDTLHRLDDKLDVLLTLLNKQQDVPLQLPTSANGLNAEINPTLDPPAQEIIDDLAGQVRKLAKTQFKTNTLQENQLAQQQETMMALQESINSHKKQEDQQQQQALELAQLELLKSLLPALDSLDAAFGSGRKQVLKQPMPTETRQAIIAWLDGVRLARMRLLDILKKHDVIPIPTLGKQFDPNKHVAVATDSSKRAANGIIVGEDRCGYATSQKILRFAEVIVAQSN